MRNRLNCLSIFVLVCIFLLAGCQTTSAPPTPTFSPVPEPSPTANPNAALVLDMVARLNAGDVDGSLAYFAEDAVAYFIGMPPTGMEFYPSREAIRPVWEYCISENFKWEVEITQVSGEFVYANTKTWMNFTQDLGVAPNDFTDVFQVKDGKIAVYASTITEDALADFKPALLEVMPLEPTPDTSSEIPGSELSFTSADHSCSYDGPAVIQAGEIKVNWEVKDQDRDDYALTFFTLDEGKDMVDLMASTINPGPPAWSDMIFIKELGPGGSQTYSFSLKEGASLYVICWSKPPDIPIANFGPFEVKQ